MITVSIMAILLAIALPRFSNLVRKANEAATVGKLSAIRGSLTIYYADNEGSYPTDLSPLMTPGSKYLTGMVPMYTWQHGSSDAIDYEAPTSSPTDAGGWAYVNVPMAAQWGNVFVDCTHTDLKGKIWSSY
jgi:type II secretory pathway pseudopilin PulG